MSLNSLSLYSEPYSSTGNIGENFRRLLGAPSLDTLQAVIREALQNVADAAKLGAGPEILIRIRRITEDQRRVLRQNVFANLPTEQTLCDALKKFLEREEAIVMEICDFNTSGLGGPLRADCIPIGITQTDFIDFLRNIGVPRDTEHGGGTYGFGKVALYRASRCNTILVDTLVSGDGEGARRLIGCHIGRSFEIPEKGMLRRFTGRHWWGQSNSRDSVVDPILDIKAEKIASALGFPSRKPNRTGTSIMILDFDSEGEDLNTVGRRIVESILWSFWPRMMRDTPASRRFNCSVEVDGTFLEVPDPEEFSPLDLYTKAMRAARNGAGNNVYRITSQRPRKDLGYLAIEEGLRTPRHPIAYGSDLFPPVSKHIALMRPVELVVKYLDGNALPDERLEWAGVFIVSNEDDVERAFADSEPPAHDDWVPDSLSKSPARTFVNVALRKLKEHAFEMGGLPPSQATPSISNIALAKVAGRLGETLEGVGSDGAQKNRRQSNKRRKPIRARASQPVFKRLEHDTEGILAIFSTEVSQDHRRSGALLTAKAAVAIDGTAARHVDNVVAKPTITTIQDIDGKFVSTSDQLDLKGAEGLYEIYVRVPPECAVTVDAQVLTKDDE